MKKWNFISSFLRLSRWSRRENEQARKQRNGISFLRLFVLSRCTSRQNEEMEFHFFVSSFCRVGQGAKTNKRENEEMEFPFLRFGDLYNATKRTNGCITRQNEEMDFISSFLRLSRWSKHDKTTKRQSYREISKFDFSWLLVRFVVCSFCRLPQGAKKTERQRDKMRFLRPFRFVVCSFCCVIQVAKTKKWNFILAFVRFVAFHKAPKRTNEMAVSGSHIHFTFFWLSLVFMTSVWVRNEGYSYMPPPKNKNNTMLDLITNF